MVRKPARKAARSSAAAKPAAPAAAGSEREKIIAAFLALLAEKPIEQIGFAEIAKEAGVSLGQLRGEFASTLAIFAAHIKATDRAVLAEDLSDMAEEPPRERLFDVLMRRLEVLAPHRKAVRSLLRSARRNPPLALALTDIADEDRIEIVNGNFPHFLQHHASTKRVAASDFTNVVAAAEHFGYELIAREKKRETAWIVAPHLIGHKAKRGESNKLL